MTPVNFCYWLQGLFELGNVESLSKEQTDEIKKHLYCVFEHYCEKISTPKKDDWDKFKHDFNDWNIEQNPLLVEHKVANSC